MRGSANGGVRLAMVASAWARGVGWIAGALAALALAGGAAGARVCEGPGINFEAPAATSDKVLSVLAFNVYLLPSHIRNVPVLGERFALAQDERADRIPPFLAPYDVVLLSEAYDDEARAALLAGMAAEGFTYRTDILGSACRAAASCEKGRVYRQDPMANGAARGGEGDTWFGEDGGVLIASKFPITDARELIYADCTGPDCNAAKGFVYARIEKGHQPYHVVGTHAQFGWGSEQRAVKRAQFRAIVDFLQGEAGIPRSEPVLIGGDFNILRHEFDGLLEEDMLGAIAPEFLGYRYTRESRNDWARRGNGYVDYVVAKSAWRTPRYSSNCPVVFRTRYDFENRTLLSVVRGEDYCDLSDHYAVWGYFDYRGFDAPRPECPMPEFPASRLAGSGPGKPTPRRRESRASSAACGRRARGRTPGSACVDRPSRAWASPSCSERARAAASPDRRSRRPS